MVEAKCSQDKVPETYQRFKVSYGAWITIVRFLEQLEEISL